MTSATGSANQSRHRGCLLPACLPDVLQAVPLVHGSASSRDQTKALARALLSSTLPAALATATLPLLVRALPVSSMELPDVSRRAAAVDNAMGVGRA